MSAEVQRPKWDYIMLLVALGLTALGLVMVLSASSLLAEKRFGDPYHFFRPQVVYVLLGLMVMMICRKIPYDWLCRSSYLMLGIIILALVLVLIPGIGHRVGGASRWLRFGGISLQPSEFAKVVLVIFLAYSLSAKREVIRSFFVGLVPNLIILGLLVGLVVVEPDLGAAVIMTVIAGIMFFISGVPLRYLTSLALLAIPVVYLAVVRSPYRLKRITAFLTPWDDPLGTGYHIIHSFMAFASGGLTGVGPGAGKQKLFFLPEPHTDFIFSVVGEELGFVGVALIALLFLILVWRGFSVSLNAYELQGSYLALGLTLIIGLQAFMNMAVVVGLMPTKGLILPFFSYGGSAMLVNFICLGLIFNVAGHGKTVPARPSRGRNA